MSIVAAMLAATRVLHQSRLRPVIAGALFVTLLNVSSAAAQESSAAGFVDFRYATRTSLSLYGGYDLGPAILVLGMVQNPRTDYREVIGGLGRVVGGGGLAATVAVAGSFASDGWYGQLYVLPDVALGPVLLTGLILAYEPLEERATRQFYLNPLTLLVPAGPRFSLGWSHTLATQTGLLPSHRSGPEVRVRLEHLTASLTVLAGLRGDGGELRMGIRANL